MTDDEKRQRRGSRQREDSRERATRSIEVLPLDEAKKSRRGGDLRGEVRRHRARPDDRRRARSSSAAARTCSARATSASSRSSARAASRRACGASRRVTGAGALDYVRELEDELAKSGERLQGGAVRGRGARRQAAGGARSAAIARSRSSSARSRSGGGGRDLLAEVRDVAGIKVLATRSTSATPRRCARSAISCATSSSSGVIVLAGTGGAEVKLIAMVTKDLVDKVQAGKLLAEVATALGGRAGGRPDMAQGGGKDLRSFRRRSRLPEVGRRARLVLEPPTSSSTANANRCNEHQRC